MRLDESRVIVQSNAVVTAGAALSHLHLALTLIRRASTEQANLPASITSPPKSATLKA